MLTNEQGLRLKSYLSALKPTVMGRLLYHYFPFKRMIVLKNMHLVFGNVLNDDEIKKLAVCYYSYLSTMIKEYFQSCFLTLKQIERKMEFVIDDHLKELFKKENKSFIFLTGHFGNWEIAGIGFSMYYAKLFAKGTSRLCVVRKPIKPKFLESFVFRNIHRSGIKIIRKSQAADKMRCLLKNNHSILLLMDQHACLKPKDGIAVNFFGKKAGTFKSLALLVRYTQVPVIPSRSYRRHSDGKHVIELFPQLSWLKHEDKDQELALNTSQYNQVFERFILDYPEQWNWMHKRWKDNISNLV